MKMVLPPQFPYDAFFRIYLDGEIWKELPSTPTPLTVGLDKKGLYRLEVWAKPHTLLRAVLNSPVPYVFYNPIHVQ